MSGLVLIAAIIIPILYKRVNVTSLFSCTARLWNSLPSKYFLLTYDLNGFQII